MILPALRALALILAFLTAWPIGSGAVMDVEPCASEVSCCRSRSCPARIGPIQTSSLDGVSGGGTLPCCEFRDAAPPSVGTVPPAGGHRHGSLLFSSPAPFLKTVPCIPGAARTAGEPSIDRPSPPLYLTTCVLIL